jgi:hypothetical protein
VKVESISERISFVRKDEELSIVIMAATNRKRAKIIAAILLLWLFGGALMVKGYFGMTDQKSKIMLLIWLAFWLYFTYVMVKALMWQWSGKEIMKIREGKLFYKRDTGGRGWVHAYELKKIEDIEIAADKSPEWMRSIGFDYWNVDCNSIHFKYEDREIALGFALTEKEKEKLVKMLRRELGGK